MLVGGAGGLEVLPVANFGIGAEAGFIGGGGDLALTFSVSATARFHRGQLRTVVPFVAAGVTGLGILTDTGQNRAWHLRAGVNYGVGRHAVRLEFVEIFRRHAWTDYYSLFRVGVTFR
jgi:hypothetical protein